VAWAKPRQKTPAVSTAPAAPDHLREAELALEEKRYVDAVNAFVEADRVERNMAALGRAFEAANLADDPLLLVQVSERILSRPEVSDEGRTLARRAVAKASDHLTQLELVCGERECEFLVDGQSTLEGISYWRPGAHEIQLVGHPETTLQVKCAARAICRFTLPQAEQSAVVAAQPAPVPAPAAVAQAEHESSAASTSEPSAALRRRGSRLPFAVMVGTAASGAVLGALALWSGIEAVRARNLHDTDPAAYDADAVRTYARRTDYFLLGAGLCAAAATATAIWWVDWDERRQTTISLEGGAGLRASHRF
jgi:hypothetical protein